jgi:hypothetical protein
MNGRPIERGTSPAGAIAYRHGPVAGPSRRTSTRYAACPRVLFLLPFLLVLPACEKKQDGGRPSEAQRPGQVASPPARQQPESSESSPGDLAADTTRRAAELGPDPDYPTPVVAGTKDLFLLEEPVRGAHVTEVALPAAADLAWTEHAYAELDAAGFAVSAAGPATGGIRWRVGREDGRIRLVEALRPDGNAVSRWVLEWTASAPPKLRLLATLDAYGTVVETRSYEPAGERYTARELSGANALPGCGAQESVVDERGLASETRCLAWHGTPMYDTSGVRMRRFERDAAGFVVAETCFGKDDEPVADQSSVHRATFERDAAGRVVRTLRFGLDGTPVRSTADGCFGRAYRHDGRGFRVAETCLDAAGKPAFDPDGVATTASAIDENGCIVAERSLGTAGEPTRDDEGVAQRAWVVDAHCAATSLACLGPGGDRAPCRKEGPVLIEYTRDDRGRVVSERNYAGPGVPGEDGVMGIFEERNRFDPLGRRVEQSCHGPTGANVLCGGTGYHAERIVYDDAGRVAEERFRGIDGSPASNLGTSIRRFEYDSYDHLSVARELDAAGQPIEGDGLASRTQLYDQGHRLFAVLLFDRDERPARYTQCFVGVDCPDVPWHAVRIVRSADGKVVQNLFFDADAQRIETMDCTEHRCWE